MASHAGRRPTMEDAHVCVSAAEFVGLLVSEGGVSEPPSLARVEIYAVMDGHNGRRVADMAAAAFPKYVAREFGALLRGSSETEKVHAWHSKKKVQAALHRACASVEQVALGSGLDAEGCCCTALVVVQDEAWVYVNSASTHGISIVKIREVFGESRGGDRAFWAKREVVNIGDSRAVLVRRDAEKLTDVIGDTDVSGAPGVSAGHKHKFPWELHDDVRKPPKARALQLTTDHRATAPQERARIIAAGGSVDPNGRAAGIMEVSRSFGDAALKRLCGRVMEDPSKNAIIAEPDTRVRISLDSAKDEFLMIACDGLWTRFKPVDARRQFWCCESGLSRLVSGQRGYDRASSGKPQDTRSSALELSKVSFIGSLETYRRYFVRNETHVARVGGGQVDAAQFVRTRLHARCSYLGGNKQEWPDLATVTKALVDDCVTKKNCGDNVSVIILRFTEKDSPAQPR